jgi:hypothetical protein
LFLLSISIPSFSLDMAGQTWNPLHWGIIIPSGNNWNMRAYENGV